MESQFSRRDISASTRKNGRNGRELTHTRTHARTRYQRGQEKKRTQKAERNGLMQSEADRTRLRRTCVHGSLACLRGFARGGDSESPESHSDSERVLLIVTKSDELRKLNKAPPSRRARFPEMIDLPDETLFSPGERNTHCTTYRSFSPPGYLLPLLPHSQA